MTVHEGRGINYVDTGRIGDINQVYKDQLPFIFILYQYIGLDYSPLIWSPMTNGNYRLLSHKTLDFYTSRAIN